MRNIQRQQTTISTSLLCCEGMPNFRRLLFFNDSHLFHLGKLYQLICPHYTVYISRNMLRHLTFAVPLGEVYIGRQTGVKGLRSEAKCCWWGTRIHWRWFIFISNRFWCRSAWPPKILLQEPNVRRWDMRFYWMLFNFNSNPYWRCLAWTSRFVSEARQSVSCRNMRIRRQLFNFSLTSFRRRLAWLPMIRLQELLRSEPGCWCWIREFISIDSISAQTFVGVYWLGPRKYVSESHIYVFEVRQAVIYWNTRIRWQLCNLSSKPVALPGLALPYTSPHGVAPNRVLQYIAGRGL